MQQGDIVLPADQRLSVEVPLQSRDRVAITVPHGIDELLSSHLGSGYPETVEDLKYVLQEHRSL
jgi:hypothetical protein